MLKLSVNGESIEMHEGSVLLDAISYLNIQHQKIAAAINGEFVPRSAYQTTHLNDSDCIDIVKPVGGG